MIIHGNKDAIGVMGTKPIHVMSAEERDKVVKIEDFFMNSGLPAEKVKGLASVGDPIHERPEIDRDGRLCELQVH